MDQQRVLQQVITWAAREQNIRAVVLTGSVARGEGAFDELSDLDIELFVSDPSELLDQAVWYEEFGHVLVVEALDNPGWHPTRLVHYADGKIDFMIAATSILADGVFYEHPFRVLLDKENVQGTFHRRAPRRAPPPAADEFLRCVQEFYAAMIMWAKHLIRNDPWSRRSAIGTARACFYKWSSGIEDPEGLGPRYLAARCASPQNWDFSHLTSCPSVTMSRAFLLLRLVSRPRDSRRKSRSAPDGNA